MNEPHPLCSRCLKSDPVICYDDTDPTRTICPECCATVEHHDGETGHQFDYDRGDRTHICRYCGIDRKCTDYQE